MFALLVFVAVWSVPILIFMRFLRELSQKDLPFLFILALAVVALFFIVGYTLGRHGFQYSAYLYDLPENFYKPHFVFVEQGPYFLFGKVWRYAAYNAVLSPFVSFSHSVRTISIVNYFFAFLVGVFSYMYLRHKGLRPSESFVVALLILLSPTTLHVLPLNDFFVFAWFYALVFFYALEEGRFDVALLAYIAAAAFKAELNYVLLAALAVSVLFGQLRLTGSRVLVILAMFLLGVSLGTMLDATVLVDVDPNVRASTPIENMKSNLSALPYATLLSPYFDRLSLLSLVWTPYYYILAFAVLFFSCLFFNNMAFTVTYKYVTVIVGLSIYGFLVFVRRIWGTRWWRSFFYFLVFVAVIRGVFAPWYSIDNQFKMVEDGIHGVLGFLHQHGVELPYLGPFFCRYSELRWFERVSRDLDDYPLVMFDDSTAFFFDGIPDSRKIRLPLPLYLHQLKPGCYYVYVDYVIPNEFGGRASRGADSVLKDLGAFAIYEKSTPCGTAKIYLLCR